MSERSPSFTDCFQLYVLSPSLFKAATLSDVATYRTDPDGLNTTATASWSREGEGLNPKQMFACRFGDEWHDQYVPLECVSVACPNERRGDSYVCLLPREIA